MWSTRSGYMIRSHYSCDWSTRIDNYHFSLKDNENTSPDPLFLRSSAGCPFVAHETWTKTLIFTPMSFRQNMKMNTVLEKPWSSKHYSNKFNPC